jgi:hypothetical protein
MEFCFMVCQYLFKYREHVRQSFSEHTGILVTTAAFAAAVIVTLLYLNTSIKELESVI